MSKYYEILERCFDLASNKTIYFKEIVKGEDMFDDCFIVTNRQKSKAFKACIYDKWTGLLVCHAETKQKVLEMYVTKYQKLVIAIRESCECYKLQRQRFTNAITKEEFEELTQKEVREDD